MYILLHLHTHTLYAFDDNIIIRFDTYPSVQVKSGEGYSNRVAGFGLNIELIYEIRTPNLPCTDNTLFFGICVDFSICS